MKTLKPVKFSLQIAIFGLISLNVAYSQNSKPVKLVYHFPTDKAVHFLSTSKVLQVMDIQGQSMDVNVSLMLACNVKSVGSQGKNLKVEVKVDSISQVVQSPQGTSGGNLDDAKGKVFNMVITPSGKEVDLSEAKKITLEIAGSGQSDMAESFVGFFPVLPENAVKTGATWASSDTLESKNAINAMYMIVRAQNKFEGFEEVNGTNCAKISYVLEGIRNMTNLSQGMEIKTNGSFTGSGVLYFSPAEGYFIRQDIKTTMKGEMEIVGQGMTFPVVIDITSVNEMKK
jgi:hypothetical protein